MIPLRGVVLVAALTLASPSCGSSDPMLDVHEDPSTGATIPSSSSDVDTSSIAGREFRLRRTSDASGQEICVSDSILTEERCFRTEIDSDDGRELIEGQPVLLLGFMVVDPDKTALFGLVSSNVDVVRILHGEESDIGPARGSFWAVMVASDEPIERVELESAGGVVRCQVSSTKDSPTASEVVAINC